MSDRHLRILGLIAQRQQRRLDAYDAAGRPTDAPSGRRLELGRWAAQTRARHVAARARRDVGPGI